MPKIPNLQIGRGQPLASRAVYFIFALFLISALSCSHFEGPEFESQGEFSTPDELLNNREVRENSRPVARGPFHLSWPVAVPVINRGYKPDGGRRKQHLGIDLGGRKNDFIYAAHDGVVVYAGRKFRGYGKMIILEYDQSWATLYGHLNSFNVKNGQEVHAGDLIGKMGRTGRATGVHLHFELIKDKEPVDPQQFLQSRAVTM